MKAFNLLFFVICLLSAGLQYNDPDPYLWIPIYMYTGVLCWLAFRQKFYPGAYLFGIIAYVGYAIFLFFTKDGVLDWANDHQAENIAQTMKATKPWIEDTREFFGLLIITFALLVNYIYTKRRAKG